MKRNVALCQIALLGLVGCTAQTTPVADSSSSRTAPRTVSQAQSGEAGHSASAILVSLKVPNMH